jgi:hypothetical protein
MYLSAFLYTDNHLASRHAPPSASPTIEHFLFHQRIHPVLLLELWRVPASHPINPSSTWK